MKTKEQIQAETFGEVFTISEWIDACDQDLFNRYDGHGYFHNGEHETTISVWDMAITWEDIKDYPYIIWYNK
jgi:hypothetical protein